MTSPWKLPATAAAALLVLSCGGGAPGPEPTGAVERTPGRPVLLVTIDTLRWDALGSYGGAARTPELDAFARRGVRFEHAVAHAVVTLPSHATILTGGDPTRHGVHANYGHRLGDGALTWAERLRSAGYATAAFVGAFPLDPRFGLSQGFDVYDASFGEDASMDPESAERRAEEVVAPALAWLAARPPPWFAWVHVYDPHEPYRAPEPFAGEYAGDPYGGEVAYVDAALAPLLQEALARDAIVIVTADHGEALGEHGEETHGLFAYASTLRVPLIAVGLPGVAAGTVVRERVRHIDVLPTVLDALGLDLEDLQGVPLWRAIARDAAGDDSYFEALTPYLDWSWKPLHGLYVGTVKYLDLPPREKGWPPLHGVYSGDLKYIDLPIPELYDVAADPDERVNLAGARPADARRLRDLLRAHMASGGAVEASAIDEDAETVRRLRALGYLGGGGRGSAVQIGQFGPEDDPKRLIRIEERIQDAVRAMRRPGEEAAAIAALEEVLEARPDLVRAYSLLATVRERQGGGAAAVAVLERAVGAGVASPYLLGRLAREYARQGRLAEAEGSVKRALASSPQDIELLGLLATIYAERGQVAAAEETFDRALALEPSGAALHAGKGTLLLSTARVAEAEREFGRALELDPAEAEAHNGLGAIAAQRGDLALAVEHWQRAVAHATDQPFVFYNLGVTLQRLDRIPEAIKALARYLELRPSDAEARAILDELRRTHEGRH